MPFKKGQSGNEQGRPKETKEQKEDRKKFKGLLKEATVPALKNIIEIACDEKSKDRFNACKFLIEKAYGANVAFLSDDETDSLSIRIIRYSNDNRERQTDC